jgi:tetratricopeptide (TPR) repeat protein
MNRQLFGVLSAGAVIAVVAAGFVVARSSRQNALLAPLSTISLDQFQPSARKVVSEMIDNVREQPLRADRWGELGYALAGNGANQEATTCFARAEELEPDNYRWPHLVAHLSIKADRPAAIAALKRATKINPNIVPTIGMLAGAYLEDGADKEADALLRPRVTDKTNDQRLLFEMARIEANAGAVEKAIALAERAASAPPRRREIHHLLAQLYQRKGDDAAARRQTRLLELLPPSDEHSNWPDAIAFQLVKYARGIDAMAFQARQLVAQGRSQDAVQLLEQMAPEEKASPSCAASLAIAKAHLEQFKEAEQILNAVEAKDDPNILFAFGIVASLQGRYAEAADHYRRLAASATSGARSKFADGAFVNQGLCFLALKKEDDAMKAFEKALKPNPGNVEAIERLAALYLKKNRKADAARILEDAALLEPNDETIKELQKEAAAK